MIRQALLYSIGFHVTLAGFFFFGFISSKRPHDFQPSTGLKIRSPVFEARAIQKPVVTERSRISGNASHSELPNGAASSASPRPNAAASGDGESAAGENASETEWDAYAARFRATIERRRHYPESLRRLGRSGTAVIAIDIERSGHIGHASIATSSGSARIDEAALDLVREQAEFAPFPDSVKDSVRTLRIPIEYVNPDI